jgi:hypothetical protein
MLADGLTTSLLVAAVGVGVVHTALGPDHYLPFVALARARGWSRARTLAVTAACGTGHVAASLALGALLLGAGASVGALEAIESGRGSFAAWALVAFGLAYGLWGARVAWRRGSDLALHEHTGHVHLHRHGHEHHRHAEGERGNERRTTFWALFLIFVLGPCEVLIPLVFVPASEGRWALALGTAAVFGVATLATMVILVAALHAGVRGLSLGGLERWSQALAGAILSASGAAMILGL